MVVTLFIEDLFIFTFYDFPTKKFLKETIQLSILQFAE